MAWGVVGNLRLIVLPEGHFHLPGVYQVENELGSQRKTVPYTGIVHLEKLRVFIPHREHAGRGRCEYLLIGRKGLAERIDIVPGIFPR